MIERLDDLDGERVRADVCVVGAGAVGLALVAELLPSSLSVVVVEGGGGGDGDDEALLAGETVRPFNGLAGRARGLGGTMQRWPGQSMELEPADLDERSWIPGSGWPIGWDELSGYYPRAWRFLGVPAGAAHRDVHAEFHVRPPRFDDSVLRPAFSVFSPQPNRAVTLHPALARARNVRVLLDATAVRIEPSAERHAAHVRSTSGREATVDAPALVLCGGGIENARLLLVSGIGGDAVGRWFQDHVALRVGHVEAADATYLQTAFGVFYRRRLRFHTKLVVARAERERRRVAACGASLVFDTPPDAGAQALARLARGVRARRLGRPLLRDAAAVARDAPGVARDLARRYCRGWSPATRPERIGVLLVAEQVPNPESRVTLADEPDALGVPRARVDWRLTDVERRTLEAGAAAVVEQFAAAGLGRVVPTAGLDGDDWDGEVFDTFHHVGATRMSAGREHGVVDADCAVHGVSGLYAAGTSVLPTSGFAHPTLTGIALAIRLADRLRERAA